MLKTLPHFDCYLHTRRLETVSLSIPPKRELLFTWQKGKRQFMLGILLPMVEADSFGGGGNSFILRITVQNMVIYTQVFLNRHASKS